jgi:iron complex transport system permease protein
MFGLLMLSFLYLAMGDKFISFCQIFTSPLVLSLRLPRLILILALAFLLSSSGLLIQTMTGNPIAEMTTLGMSGGSSLALSLLLVFGGFTSFAWNIVFSVLGAALCLTLVIVFTARSKFQPTKLILVGTSVGLFASSIASSLSFAHNDAASYLRWIVGSFSAATWGKAELAWLFLPVILLLILVFSKSIWLLSFGDELAQSLGVNIQRIRFLIIAIVTLATGLSVALVGVISFIGLMSAQIAQIIEKKRFFVILLLSNLIAAIILVFADLLARNLFLPYEFPAGALTLLLGAPFFLFLVLRKEAK